MALTPLINLLVLGRGRRNRGAPGWSEAPDKDLGEALGKAWPRPTPSLIPGPTHSPRRIRGTWKDTTASFWRTTNSKGAPFCLFSTFTDTRTPSVCRMRWKCPSVKPVVTLPPPPGIQGSRNCEPCPVLCHPLCSFSTFFCQGSPQFPGGTSANLEESLWKRLVPTGQVPAGQHDPSNCRNSLPDRKQWKSQAFLGYPIPIYVHGIHTHRHRRARNAPQLSSL